MEPALYIHSKGMVADPYLAETPQSRMFRLHRLENIVIQVYPPREFHRQNAINGYFMNLALCQLFIQNRRETRISVFRIHFKPILRSTCSSSSPWWDPHNRQPRSSAVHGISDIELVLIPFELLSGCEFVDIKLPSGLFRADPRLAQYVNTLKSIMKRPNATQCRADFRPCRNDTMRWELQKFVESRFRDNNIVYLPGIPETDIIDAESLFGDDGEDEEVDQEMDGTG